MIVVTFALLFCFFFLFFFPKSCDTFDCYSISSCQITFPKFVSRDHCSKTISNSVGKITYLQRFMFIYTSMFCPSRKLKLLYINNKFFLIQYRCFSTVNLTLLETTLWCTHWKRVIPIAISWVLWLRLISVFFIHSSERFNLVIRKKLHCPLWLLDNLRSFAEKCQLLEEYK